MRRIILLLLIAACTPARMRRSADPGALRGHGVDRNRDRACAIRALRAGHRQGARGPARCHRRAARPGPADDQGRLSGGIGAILIGAIAGAAVATLPGAAGVALAATGVLLGGAIGARYGERRMSFSPWSLALGAFAVPALTMAVAPG